MPVSAETKAWPLTPSPPTSLSLNGRFNFLLLFERKGEKKKKKKTKHPTQSRQKKGVRSGADGWGEATAVAFVANQVCLSLCRICLLLLPGHT